MGWSGDPVNVQVWAQWSWERMQMNKEVKAYRDEKGMGKTASTKFATARMDAFNAWSDRLAAANPSWGKEYDFSQLSTRERFAELGYGKSPGWRAFLGVVDDFELALKTAVVPSTGQVGLASAAGGTAAKIEDDFTPVLQKLATDYSEWFDEFSRSYSLTNFGFTKRWMQSLDEEWWAAKAPRMEEPAYTADDMWDPNL